MNTSNTVNVHPDFHLRIVEARGLYGDRISASDPYVIVKLKGLTHILNPQKQQTGVVWNNNNPVWNQDFLLQPTKTNDIILVKVYDKDKLGRDYLGRAQLSVTNFLNTGVSDMWLPLYGKSGVKVPGEIHIMANYGASAVPFWQSMSGMGYQTGLGNTGYQTGLGTTGYRTGFGTTGYQTGMGTGFGTTGYQSGIGNTGLGTTGYQSNLGSGVPIVEKKVITETTYSTQRPI